MLMWLILVLCIFFTLLVIFKPDFMWGILSAVCWMILFWYVQTYEPFALGDFGNVAFIGVCIGASAFVLLYTINDNNKKKRGEREKFESEHKPTGTRESSNDYFDRLNRLTHSKKK